MELEMESLVSLLTGGIAVPRIKGGLKHPILLVKVLSLIMSLKLMMPSARPRDPLKRDAVFTQAFKLLAATAKNERITTFQAQHTLAAAAIAVVAGRLLLLRFNHLQKGVQC